MLCKLGDVDINATTAEVVTLENEITQRRVEDRGTIHDHIQNKPLLLNIEGFVTGENASEKLELLRKYMREKFMLKYIGRNIITRLVLETFSSSHDKNVGNGYNFRCVLQQITISTLLLQQVIAPDPSIPRRPPQETRSATQNTQNLGTQTPTEGLEQTEGPDSSGLDDTQQQDRGFLRRIFDLDNIPGVDEVPESLQGKVTSKDLKYSLTVDNLELDEREQLYLIQPWRRPSTLPPGFIDTQLEFERTFKNAVPLDPYYNPSLLDTDLSWLLNE